MMPLGVADVLLILLTALACAAVVTGAAVLVLRRARRAGLTLRLVIVGVASVLALATGVLAISAEMYLSAHDFTVLVWVLGAALLCALATAWITARAARSSVRGLTAAVRRVGEGVVVARGSSGWREFDELSAELAEVSAKLSEARADLERLDSDRRRFLAWISHDLRTPLTAIRALAESAEAGLADPEAFPGQVRAQVETMGRMVDDLFELSRITSGSLRLRAEQVELLDVVSDAVADVRAAAGAHRVRIVQQGIDGQVLWADPHQLTRVIVNLLTNAVRHAPEGSEILVFAESPSPHRLVLAVLDHGSGVAVEDLDRMFEVGWRSDPSRTGGTAPDAVASGAGLGLAIARGLARAHGGDVFAEHTDDGFCLKVLLPVTPGS
ncbi:MAG: HAMP domain-containing histidine kinase [Microbacterium sp.]|jgi:signal transduction histidine kinase|uniref:sensor histidine kinase n=1 Tax=Microbacterium sp. TaxID=51671 RepID=UPI002817D95F|nr:HAMP domain-containing sensor histidine kinase [Microbacterium sp.]MDR2320604.1 HAMP domain-containing histidine kinase [Microbacterium sp.]